MYFNIEMILTYYTYQSVWVAVGEELPCQSERLNSGDPLAVAVKTGELIVGREKCPQFARFFERKWR